MRTVSFWLSLILVFMIPWEFMIDIGRPLTMVRVVALPVAAFWAVTVVVTGKFRKLHPFHIVVFIYVLWNVASAFWTVDIGRTATRILIYVQLIGITWLFWDLYTTSTALTAGLQVYVLGAYVPLISTISNYLAGTESVALRYSANRLDPNELGLTLALGIPVAWHLAISQKKSKFSWILTLVNYAFIPAAVLAILLTASRGTFIAVVPGILFVLASLTRLNLFARILVPTLLITIMFTLLPLVPQSSFDRLATTGTSIAEGDIGDRLAIWQEGVTVFTNYPLVGVGSGAFRVAVKSGEVAHNSFLSVLVEVGIIGFALFAGVLATTIYTAIRQPKSNALLWLTILLIWAIGASALTWERVTPTWLFLSLVIIGAGISIPHKQPVNQLSLPTS